MWIRVKKSQFLSPHNYKLDDGNVFHIVANIQLLCTKWHDMQIDQTPDLFHRNCIRIYLKKIKIKKFKVKYYDLTITSVTLNINPQDKQVQNQLQLWQECIEVSNIQAYLGWVLEKVHLTTAKSNFLSCRTFSTFDMEAKSHTRHQLSTQKISAVQIAKSTINSIHNSQGLMENQLFALN